MQAVLAAELAYLLSGDLLMVLCFTLPLGSKSLWTISALLMCVQPPLRCGGLGYSDLDCSDLAREVMYSLTKQARSTLLQGLLKKARGLLCLSTLTSLVQVQNCTACLVQGGGIAPPCLVNVLGAVARPNGRELNWNLLPFHVKWRYLLCFLAIGAVR